MREAAVRKACGVSGRLNKKEPDDDVQWLDGKFGTGQGRFPVRRVSKSH